jgi:hypothetical protein
MANHTGRRVATAVVLLFVLSTWLASGALGVRATVPRGHAQQSATTSEPNPGNGLSSNPDFFPIGVWLQTPTATAPRFAEIGVNTFIGQFEGNTRKTWKR